MGYILVQHYNNEQYRKVIEHLERVYQTLVVMDDDLGNAIDEHEHQIDGFVAFKLTEAVRRSAELLTNERFNAPTTPLAYVGEGRADVTTVAPYGVVRFEAESTKEMIEYLKQPRRIEILVVEDDDGIRDVLQLSLARHFKVECAADGPGALEILNKSVFDMVVLDVMLPGGLSGEDIFDHIKKTQPDTAVVIITAHDNRTRELEFSFRGADAYVAKPFDSNASFRQLLMKTLKERHERNQPRVVGSVEDESEEAWKEYEKHMNEYI